MLDLTPATAEVVRLLDDIKDDQLDGPTPCPDYSVAALLDHLMGLSMAFTWAAAKTYPDDDGSAPAPGGATAEHLEDDWRSVLPQRLHALAEAWKEASAWEGMAEAGGVTMPAEIIAVVALDEVVMHGWDLARATGQQFRCDPVSAAAVLQFTEASAAEGTPPEDAIFGPPVGVPDGAPDLHRALGFAGRDPSWTAAPAR